MSNLRFDPYHNKVFVATLIDKRCKKAFGMKKTVQKIRNGNVSNIIFYVTKIF